MTLTTKMNTKIKCLLLILSQKSVIFVAVFSFINNSIALDEMYSQRAVKYTNCNKPITHDGSTIPKDFHQDLALLAKKLQVQVHERVPVTIEACRIVVENLVKNQSAKSQKTKYSNRPIGFDTGDDVMNQVGLVMRLLHIEELRKLQTEANKIIVQTQALTANPITDTKLGKIGRG